MIHEHGNFHPPRSFSTKKENHIFSCIIWCLAWPLEYMIVCADHNMWWSGISMATLVYVYVPRSYHYNLALTRVFLGVQIYDIPNLAIFCPKKKERPNLVNWIYT
jgi:hypothetical protein